MTRDEALNKAIGILTYNQVNFCKSKEAVASMNEIIEALEKIDQEPCGDCISRDAVMHILDEVGGDFDSPREAVVPIDYIADMVSELPSVTPKQRTSVWVAIDQEPHETWECGLCGFVIDGSGCVDPDEYRDIYKYCPNCGCKMQEVKDGTNN